MDNDITDLLYDALDTIGIHNTKLAALNKVAAQYDARLQETKAALQLELERSSKQVLTQLLNNLSLNVNNEINLDSYVESNQQLLSQISEFINTSINKEIVSNVEIKVDTSDIAKEIAKLLANDTNKHNQLIDGFKKQSQENKALLQELVSMHSTMHNKEFVITANSEAPAPVKSMTINRDKAGNISTIDLKY